MPRVSKVKLHQEKIHEIAENFAFLVSSLRKSSDVQHFFHEFLTHEEQIMLAKRLTLFMMIQKQYPNWVIQAALNLSHETIRIYTSSFSSTSPSFQKLIGRLIEKEETKAFWSKIDNVLKPLDLAMRAKHDMRARAKLMSGDWN